MLGAGAGVGGNDTDRRTARAFEVLVFLSQDRLQTSANGPLSVAMARE